EVRTVEKRGRARGRARGQGSVEPAVRADAVAAAVHLGVKLVGCREIEGTHLVLQVGAEGPVEAAVIAVQEQVAAARVVSSGTVRRTQRGDVVVGVRALTERVGGSETDPLPG